VNFELTDEQRQLQATIREFAQQEIAPHAEAWDREHTFPLDVIRKLGSLGVMGLSFPEEYGGLGAGTLSQALAIEELARVDSSVAITVGASVSLGGAPLLLFGSEEQKQRWLVPLARGEIIGAFGSTEPGMGSDVAACETRADERDGSFVINGTKSFITNAGTSMSGFVIITALTGQREGMREVSTILVPNGTPGYVIGRPYRKIGWHASDTRELVFSDCRVDRACLLGPRGDGVRHFLSILDGGRIGVAALGVGLAQGCLDISLAYAHERKTFGQPIARYQAIQFMLAELATQVQAARLLTYEAALLKDNDESYSKAAAMAKLFASELAVKAADVAVQVHGGLGYMDDTPAARFYRDAKILTLGEGTSEIMKIVIARRLGLGS
jgi:alkylation response protein AidB-like acyl-CoA dehydrogenase